MHLTHALERAACVNGRGTATQDGQRRQTWARTRARVARLAAGLRALGTGRGDRVAVLAHNSDRYFEAYFAVLWAGGVIVPLNVRWAPPELAFALADSGARLLLTDAVGRELDNRLGELGRVSTMLHLDGAGEPATEALIEQHAPARDAGRGGPDLAAICYTGGTTGRAKGVMLSHANLYANALANVAHLGLRQDDVYLHAAPMFHLADGLATWAMTLVAGTHVFVPRFEPEAVLAAIAERGVTFTTLVPTMVQALVDHPGRAAWRLDGLRRLFYGASPMPEAVLRRTIDALPGCAIFGAYGMTELSPIATILDPEHHVLEGPRAGRIASVGRPVFCTDLRIVDPDGRELPAGAVGELIARGPNVMQGYWNRARETAGALREGWLHSGDAGWMDEDGFVYIADRLKDMILSGGENVYSAEVENAIYRHPDVVQCAVIGVPDERWGERVHAVVVRRPGSALDEAALAAHCRELIAGYKCPRSVEFREDPLPLSGAGKVLKAALRAAYRHTT